MRDREGGAGKGVLLNSVANDGESPRKRKLLFLVRESGRGCNDLS